MKRIRTAILGYGRSGSTLHAGPIEKLDAFEPVAVCDIDPARLRLATERFGCPVYGDYHEMLARAQPDLVCVITRNDQHCAMACDCLRAGAHVLVTKPWAANQSEAERMMAAARASNRLLLPWLPARWGSGFLRLKALLAAQTIGRVFLIRRTVASFGTRSDWQTRRSCAGGYLLNWGPHIVDPAVLLGGARVRSVFARLGQIINPGDVEDLFLAVLTLDNGTIVQAEYTISPAAMPGWMVQGDRGTIVVTGDNLTLVRATPVRPDDPTKCNTMNPEAPSQSDETIGGKPYGDEFVIYEAVSETLLNGQPFPVPPEDALELTRIFDAIRESDAANQVVALS